MRFARVSYAVRTRLVCVVGEIGVGGVSYACRYRPLLRSRACKIVIEGTDYDWRGGGGDSRHKEIGIGRRRYSS
jgi:hypothetical protein